MTQTIVNPDLPFETALKQFTHKVQQWVSRPKHVVENSMRPRKPDASAKQQRTRTRF